MGGEVGMSPWWATFAAIACVAGFLWCTELFRGIRRYLRSRVARQPAEGSAGLLAGDVDRPVSVPLAMRGWSPVVDLLAGSLGPALPVGLRIRLQRQLRRAGLDDETSPQHVMASSGFWGSIGALLAVVPAVPAGAGALLAGLGLLMPWLSLRDLEKRQRLQIARELPGYVEMLTLALEAGGALSVALRVATDRARDGVLRRGFLRVQGDMRAGRTRTDALRALAERFEDPAVTALVAALIQAEASGTSLASVLRAQAEQRLNERFTRAEKQALEAPVKMLGPLVLCIFPCTFLMLALPILVRFL